MLQWNELHSYNAVHVIRLSARLEEDRLRQIIERTLLQVGITSLKLDRRRGSYEYQSGNAGIALRCAAYSESELRTALTREINTPFETDGPFCPIRFFALSEPDSFVLGAAYFHPVADAESLVLVLKRIIAAYQHPERTSSPTSFHLYPARYDRIWWSRPALTLRKLMSLPVELRDMRRSRRLHMRDAEDLSNGCSLLTLEEKTLAMMLSRARSWNVTLHDLLLALLMKAVTDVMPLRERTRRRRYLSIGTIVNIRGDCAIDRERTFGLFLGSFFVSHRVPPRIGLQELAADIRRQTRRIKEKKSYLATPLQLLFAKAFFSLYSTRRRKLFYHRFHPLGGGISNMSMDGYWDDAEESGPMDYFRVVSTGPVTPLVMSATTYRRGMTLATSYQTSVFTAAHVEKLQERLCQQIHDMEVSA